MSEIDLSTQDFPKNETDGVEESFEDFYISCSRGCKIIHTYDDDYELALLFLDKIGTLRNVVKDIRAQWPDLDIKVDECGSDGYIYFKDKDMAKIVKVVKPKTSGNSIKPLSPKNLPKIEYTIPAEDLAKLYSIVDGLSKVEKMQFLRKINSQFIDTYFSKKKFKESRLKSKEFIHSNGMWDKYVRYVKKNLASL